MRRRELAAYLLGSAAAMWSLAAHAQPMAMPAVGLLSSRSPTESAPLVAAFHQGLGEAGYIEGENVVVEQRWAEGRYERLPALAAELVGLQVALIVAAGGDRSALAAKAATSTIPIVFTGSDDPIRFGLVASLSRPGGNVTGVSLFTSELEVKRFALLRELVPEAPLIAMLVNSNNPTAETDVREVQAAASAAGQRMLFLEAGSEQDIDAAFETLVRQEADALLVAHDPFFNSRRAQLTALAARHAIPAIYEFREFVLAGGLMSYGSRLEENYYLAGVYTGRILKGAEPGNLPVQRPSTFELVINLGAAKSLGLTVPPTLLARADEVIE